MMGAELAVNKELATIGVTLTEFCSIVEFIQNHIPDGEFCDSILELVSSVSYCYEVVIENFQPWLAIGTASDFSEKFDSTHECFKQSFLREAGKSRPHVELAYEQYQQLKNCREFSTSFPVLRYAFHRLDEYIDKWIDNDTWLMMTLDRLFKMLNRFLQDISEIKRKDIEGSFELFRRAIADFGLYTEIVKQKYSKLSCLIK